MSDEEVQTREVTITQVYLGFKPYVLIELDEDGTAGLRVGGGISAKDAIGLTRTAARAIKKSGRK